MSSILREQWILSKNGINLDISDELPDFERQVYINFYVEEKKNEEAAMNQKQK